MNLFNPLSWLIRQLDPSWGRRQREIKAFHWLEANAETYFCPSPYTHGDILVWHVPKPAVVKYSDSPDGMDVMFLDHTSFDSLLEATEHAMGLQAKYPPLEEGQAIDGWYPTTAWPTTRPYSNDPSVMMQKFGYGYQGPRGGHGAASLSRSAVVRPG